MGAVQRLFTMAQSQLIFQRYKMPSWRDFGLSRTVHDKHLYEPAEKHPPIWWMRSVLILTCTGVSFAHGTNDGQKSIGLIMLTIIGLFPAIYALNPMADQSLSELPNLARQVEPRFRNMAMIRRGCAKGGEGFGRLQGDITHAGVPDRHFKA